MEETKKWEFRELKSPDIFPMFSLLKKIGFRQFKECFASPDIAKAVSAGGIEAVGFGVVIDIAGVIIENMNACKEDLYSLLESVSNLNRKQLDELSMAEFFEMIVDFFARPDFADFFKVVSKLFK